MNIFIEFEIIKRSDPSNLAKELDILIGRRNKLYSWSKTIPIITQKNICSRIILQTSNDETELHKKIRNMRDEGYTYDEISNETKVDVKNISWYITTNPDKKWTINDWIADYYLKDPIIYPKVDAIIDDNENFIKRFKEKGYICNYIYKV